MIYATTGPRGAAEDVMERLDGRHVYGAVGERQALSGALRGEAETVVAPGRLGAWERKRRNRATRKLCGRLR